MISISEWLKTSVRKLRDSGVKTPRLDAELIVAQVLERPREWILAHDDFEIPDQVLNDADLLIKRRTNREPLAYILGYKEFYGRNFAVSPEVLVPRPETEIMIEALLSLREAKRRSNPATKSMSCRGADTPRNDEHFKILDIGTGSGILAITAKLEFPAAEVFAADISENALKIARQNAEKHGAKVTFLQSDLLNQIDEKFDVILANLPYVGEKWQTSPETKFEPQIALFADDDGLMLIKKLVQAALNNLNEDGFLILEMDSRQIPAIKDFASYNNFAIYDEKPFTLTLQKIS